MIVMCIWGVKGTTRQYSIHWRSYHCHLTQHHIMIFFHSPHVAPPPQMVKLSITFACLPIIDH